MSIKPIDLQTNIGQMSEIGRHEQNRHNLLVEQQLILDKESNEKSRLKNSKLDEAEKGEKTSIKDENRQGMKHGHEGESKDEQKKDQKMNSGRMTDDKIGRIIDILK